MGKFNQAEQQARVDGMNFAGNRGLQWAAAQPERSASPDGCQFAGSNRAPGGLPLRFLLGVGLFVWIRWRAFLRRGRRVARLLWRGGLATA
jgi:hypothetical protein